MNPFKDRKHPLQATGMLTPQELDGPGKLFMRAGKSLDDNVLKSYLTEEQAGAIADLVCQYGFFGLDDPKGPQMKRLNLWCLGRAAINGRASIFALQGSTLVFSERVTARASGLDIRDLEPEQDNSNGKSKPESDKYSREPR